MGEPNVKCMVCGEYHTGHSALDHKEKTGHNKFELLIPKQVKDGKDKEAIKKAEEEKP